MRQREVWRRRNEREIKRGNGDMHAEVLEVEAQAHPVLSNIFDYIGISNCKKKIKNMEALKGKSQNQQPLPPPLSPWSIPLFPVSVFCL